MSGKRENKFEGLAEKYPWCAPLCIAKERQGEEKKSLSLLMRSLGATRATQYLLTAEQLSRPSTDSIIDKFMEVGEYKVIAQDDTPDNLEWQSETMPNDEEEFVSEQLAEIYAQQGLFDQAKETYRKLSLLYPKKSIYFAELIEKLDNRE
ncbi:MAG: hypothetical protein J6Q40_02745 [Tidjanibacter sp.]|nr:hypothetical protein [Tidjanibacter sp.]